MTARLYPVALSRLIDIAKGDTGQGCLVANFLLAWWNGAENGGFDLQNLWGLDDAVAVDVVSVFNFVSLNRVYPDALGFDKDFQEIHKAWRTQAIPSSGPRK